MNSTGFGSQSSGVWFFKVVKLDNTIGGILFLRFTSFSTSECAESIDFHTLLLLVVNAASERYADDKCFTY